MQNNETAPAPLLANMMTREELMRELDCSVHSIMKMEAAGLPFCRIGLRFFYDRDAVRAWIAEQVTTRRRVAKAA